MKIVYVHHGNRKLGNPPTQEDDLTEIGYKDCEVAGEIFLSNKNRQNYKAIYTSPFFRCKKTAEIINNKLNLPIIEDKRLNEMGSIPNETWVDLQTRVGNLLDEIISKYDKNDIVICVTSGVNISAFINKAYNLKPSENAPFLGVPSCSPIIFDYKGE